MLVITHWRPMAARDVPGFDAQIDGVLGLIPPMKQKIKQVKGLQKADLYFNTAGMEIVSIDHLADFAVMDALAKNELNTQIGLRLVQQGYGIHSVEYLHEIKELSPLRAAYQALPPLNGERGS
jgi:hypothetical protein